MLLLTNSIDGRRYHYNGDAIIIENGTQHGTKINKSRNCYYYCNNKTLPRNYAHWKQGKIVFSHTVGYYNTTKAKTFKYETLACALLNTRHYNWINKMQEI